MHKNRDVYLILPKMQQKWDDRVIIDYHCSFRNKSNIKFIWKLCDVIRDNIEPKKIIFRSTTQERKKYNTAVCYFHFPLFHTELICRCCLIYWSCVSDKIAYHPKKGELYVSKRRNCDNGVMRLLNSVCRQQQTKKTHCRNSQLPVFWQREIYCNIKTI